MAEDKPEKPIGELIAELAKRLPSPTSLGESTSSTDTNWLEALGYLAKLGEQQKTAVQKRASETNTVDNASANAWFNDHWKGTRNCSICQSVNWAMTTQFAHVSLSLLGRYAPVRMFPCVVLTCRTCGQTLFFNAVVMGLLPEGAE
jgi:hypothetical protein